jgi:hypothetical protein
VATQGRQGIKVQFMNSHPAQTGAAPCPVAKQLLGGDVRHAPPIAGARQGQHAAFFTRQLAIETGAG